MKDFKELYDALNDRQKEIVDTVEGAIMVQAGPGCLAKGTKILMFDGSIKSVEDVEENDLVMGPDSCPRRVYELKRGRQTMYKVIPQKGTPFVCNEDHILTVSRKRTYSTKGLDASMEDVVVHEMMNKKISLDSQNFSNYKLQRYPVEFTPKDLPIDPYFVGVWLAEGSKQLGTVCLTIGNDSQEIVDYFFEFCFREDVPISIRQEKGACYTYGILQSERTAEIRDTLRTFKNDKDIFIPQIWLTSSREQRLELLAGLLDGDGYNNRGGFEIITKFDGLNDSILFLARSLGLAAYSSIKIGRIKSLGFEGEYHRIYISGDTHLIPTKVERKKAQVRRQIKSVLRTGFRIEKLDVDNYYGFTLDGDGRFLLGDFTVTHNSGKTHTLSTRIGNMLKNGGTIEPHNILCLTFTDTGAVAMRQRLLKFMGPEAYKVVISTFHSFCNDVIQNNLDYFGIKEMEPVSRLEQISITEKIIDSLSYDHPLKRLTGNIYFEVNRLLYTWELMQKENWSFTLIKQLVDDYISNMPFDEEFIYKRGNSKRMIKAGDFNQNKADGVIEKLQKFVAAAGLYDIYQAEMKRANRYSFNDMISWVVKAFSENETMLLEYQERYQYVVVDEAQDSSGSQLVMINLLMSYWDNPNLMCVLDKNQTIYSFANARIKNIQDIIDKYNPVQITLDKNYRSTQKIVDVSHEVINSDVHIAGMNPDSGSVEIRKYSNFMQESAYIAEEIMALIDSGVKPDEIAVIYRKHAHAEDILKILYANEIPINTKRKVNVLDNIVVKQLLQILQYLVSPERGEKSDLFFLLLHYNFFEVNRRQIERLLILLRSGGTIQDLDARSFKTVNRVIKILEDAENIMHNGSLLQLMNELYYKTGIKDILLKDGDKVTAACLKTFFNFVQEENAKNIYLDVNELLELIRRMRSNNVSLEIEDLVSSESGVFFTTAHGSKGDEREYIFCIRLNRSDWEKARAVNNSYSMPPNLTYESANSNEEEQRRLFYVAISRAKTHLYMSCSDKDNKGKDMEPSQFLLETKVPVTEIEECNTLPYLDILLQPEKVPFNPEIDDEKLDEILSQFRMSPSTLNLYLKCPLSFYYERILKVPYIQSYPAVYGSCCHYAVDKYYRNHCSEEEFVQYAEKYMDKYGAHLSNKERGQMINAFRRILPEFYNKYLVGSSKICVTEWKTRDVVIEGVPCYGEIDKLEFDNIACDIIDFKTGKAENAKLKMKAGGEEEKGGDYWRQLIFYKLLVEETKPRKWNPRELGLITIGKDPQYLSLTYDHNDITVVKNQIKQAYKGIMNKKFNGCGDLECRWCNAI